MNFCDNMKECYDPPKKALERTEYKIICRNELVSIGCGKRIDSVQPEKNSIPRKGKKKRCTPFSCLGGPNGPTEREQISDYLM